MKCACAWTVVVSILCAGSAYASANLVVPSGSVHVQTATYAPGDVIRVDYDVANAGNATSGGFDVYLYASRNTTITHTDFRLGLSTKSGLVAGERITFSDQGVFPADILAQTYCIGILVDWSGADKTGATTNWITVSTNAADADVEATSVSTGAQTLSPGGAFQINYGITNRGPATSHSISARLYLSDDTVVTGADILLSTQSKPGLPAHTGVSATANVIVPTDCAPGDYFVGVILDCDNDVKTSNNSLCDPVHIIGIPSPTATFGGTVFDRTRLTGVTNATVRWGRWSVITSSNGGFVFTNVPCASQEIEVTCWGYEPYVSVYSPPPYTSSVTNILLEHLAGPVVTNVTATNTLLLSGTECVNSKEVAISYELQSEVGECTVEVWVSTNRGQAFQFMAQSCRGDGYTPPVKPGNQKRILWDAGKDWNNRMSIDMCLEVRASDGYAWGTNRSNIFTLDTGDGCRPIVVDLASPFSNKEKHTYFLEDVGLLVPRAVAKNHVPFPVPFATVVDWNGKQPGKIELYTTKSQVRFDATPWPAPTTNSACFWVDVAILPAGDRLRVKAIALDGVESLPCDANVDIIPAPLLLGPLLMGHPTWAGETTNGLPPVTVACPAIALSQLLVDAIKGGNGSVAYLAPSFSMDVFKGKEGVPVGDMPLFSGEKMAVQPSLEVGASVSGDGSGSISASLEFGREIKLNGTQSRQKNGRFAEAASYSFAPRGEVEIDLTYKDDHALWGLDGYVGIGCNWGFSSPPVYLWAIPPVYFRVDLSADIAAQFRVFQIDGDELSPEFRMPGEIMVSGVLGCGASGLAGIEGYLTGGPQFEFQAMPLVCDSFGIGLRAGARVYLLCFSYDLEALSYDWWMIKDGHAVASDDRLGDAIAKLRNSNQSVKAIVAPKGFRLLPSPYLSRGRYAVFANKHLDGSALQAVAPQAVVAGGVLESDVYPFSEPAVCSAGTNTLLLWLWHDPSRLDENRTRLQWSRRTGAGAWSAPLAVWDEGTGDYTPSAAVWQNGTALVTWQNGREALAKGAGSGEALKKLEIAVAYFDGATWNAQNLTLNQILDHSPQLRASANGSALLSWTENAAAEYRTLSDYLGTSTNRNTFRFARWSGAAWSPVGAIASGIGMTLWTTLAYDGTNGVFLAAVDQDNDQSTMTDQEIYGSQYAAGAWGTFKRMTTNSVQDTRPQAVYDASGNLLVAWYQGSNLVISSSTSLASPQVVGAVGGSSSAKDFRLIAGPDGQVTLLWEDVREDGGAPDPLVLNYDVNLKVWSRSVALLSDDLLERSFAGTYLDNGDLLLAYNRVYTPMDTNSVPHIPIWTNQVVDLCLLEYRFGVDLSVVAGEVSFSTNLVPGQTVDVSVVVHNQGEMGATNVTIAFYEGHPATNGYTIADPLIISNVLAGGSSVTVTQQWVVPESGSPKTFCVVADPELVQEDRNRANNMAAGHIMVVDLTVSDAWVLEPLPTMRIVKAAIYNGGVTPSTNGFDVEFRRGTTNGPVLATVPVGYLGANQSFEAAFAWDLNGAAFTSAFETVYAISDAQNVVFEEVEDNNRRAIQVMTCLDSDGDGVLDGVELRQGLTPGMVDSDGDGLSDADELTRYGTDPSKADSDGDGASDLDEVLSGTDSWNVRDVFRITDIASDGGTNRIRWNVKNGKTYAVQTGNLAGAWGNAPDGAAPAEKHERTASTNGVLDYVRPASPATPSYYRVRLK